MTKNIPKQYMGKKIKHTAEVDKTERESKK